MSTRSALRALAVVALLLVTLLVALLVWPALTMTGLHLVPALAAAAIVLGILASWERGRTP